MAVAEALKQIGKGQLEQCLEIVFGHFLHIWLLDLFGNAVGVSEVLLQDLYSLESQNYLEIIWSNLLFVS